MNIFLEYCNKFAQFDLVSALFDEQRESRAAPGKKTRTLITLKPGKDQQKSSQKSLKQSVGSQV